MSPANWGSYPHEIAKSQKYNNIFTLNYYEYWDQNSKVVYLHGKIKKNDDGEFRTSETDEVIFSPAFPDKIKSEVENLGCYPSGRLYPEEDLYPKEEVVLYEKLDNIDGVEIFGVSPFGGGSCKSHKLREF